jgi:DNA modification methylase
LTPLIPYVQDRDFTLYNGDVREVLAALPDESVHCALTSPPFYALRDYGVEGQIGLEETPEAWAAELVAVFREVRRVLRPDGTLWVECGDSYNANQGAGFNAHAKTRPHLSGEGVGQKRLDEANRNTVRPIGNVKPKDLLGQPWLLAFALRADGWWLRQAIIWHKPNCMPESATDRCTTAHSYVFLLSKSARYHFDADAIAEPAEWARWGDQTVPKYEGTDTASGWMQPKTKAELVARGGRTTNGQKPRTDERRGFDNRLERADGQKNPRSVWTIPTQGYPDAHFATWPEALVERIVKAGCPEGGTCLDPFMGSGTTALVARKHGRKSIGIELNTDYCALAATRLQQQSLLTESVA